MSRVMGDAIGTEANTIPKDVDLIAPYITGLFGVQWNAADLALFPGIPQATIDQGAGVSPRYDAVVIDIETGAYDVSQVTNWMNNATADRPTVYVNQGNEFNACLAALQSPRFKGDVWLAFPGWQPGQALPILPAGCKYVAVQNFSAPNYDLSVVIDDTWMEGTEMNADLYRDATTGAVYLLNGGKVLHITDTNDYNELQKNGHVTNNVSSAMIAAMLVAFPPGQPAVTATIAPSSFPPYEVTPVLPV